MVSPLTAVLVAGVPVGVGVALGERPTGIAVVGIVLALVAVVLVSREVRDEDSTTAPLHGQGRLADGRGGAGVRVELRADRTRRPWMRTSGRWCSRGSRPARSSCVVALFTRNLAAPTGTPLRLALAAGVLDTIANVAMLLALHASLLSLASVLISLYPAATVALALVVLKERVTRWQAVGMVLALIAVAMIATG